MIVYAFTAEIPAENTGANSVESHRCSGLTKNRKSSKQLASHTKPNPGLIIVD